MATALLLPGSSSDGPEFLEWFAAHGGDKLVHAGLFFGQAFWVARLWPRARPTVSARAMSAWGAAALSALYGAALEGAQMVIPSRGFDWADILANTAGALAYPLLAALLRRR